PSVCEAPKSVGVLLDGTLEGCGDDGVAEASGVCGFGFAVSTFWIGGFRWGLGAAFFAGGFFADGLAFAATFRAGFGEGFFTAAFFCWGFDGFGCFFCFVAMLHFSPQRYIVRLLSI